MKYHYICLLAILFSLNAMAKDSKEWLAIDSLMNNQLPASAKTEILKIKNRAKSEHKRDEELKAIIYLMRCSEMSEEDATEKNINFLEQELKIASFPSKAVLHSMLGEQYKNYFQSNRFRNGNASSTKKSIDLKTMDNRQLLDLAKNHYQASIENKNTLLAIYSLTFAEVIQSDSLYHKYTASLYDFLARRTLDFYTSTEGSLTKPAEQFNLNNPVYFSGPNTFVNTNINSKDSLSLHYAAILLFQELEKTHIKDIDQSLIFDLVMERISFCKQNSSLNNKDDLELATLEELASRYAKETFVAEVYWKLATIWQQRSELKTFKDYSFPNANIKALAYAQKGLAIEKSEYSKACANTIAEIKKPELQIDSKDVSPYMQAIKLSVNYKNLPDFILTVYKIDYITFKQHTSQYDNNDNNRQLNEILKFPTTNLYTYQLPSDPNLHRHTTELAVHGLNNGFYVLIATSAKNITNSEYISYKYIQVNDWEVISRSTGEENQLYVLDRLTGKPVKEAEVTAIAQNYDYRVQKNTDMYLTKFMTNAEGFGSFQNQTDKNGTLVYEIRKGNEILISNNGYIGNYYRNNELTYDQKNMAIFTDRSIYRPGQTVYYKAILYKSRKPNDFNVIAKQAVDINFYDTNGKLMGSQKLATNEFGSVSGSFIAPVGSLTGSMRIGNDMGNVYFNVEEYKRPKFEVKIEPTANQYALNEKVSVIGKAEAYSGQAIENAKVSYKVTRKANFPIWCGYKYYIYPEFNQETVITTGTSTTDGKGTFPIDFIANPDPEIPSESQAVFHYEITADVIDLNGETRSNKIGIDIGFVALTLNIQNQENLFVGDSILLSSFTTQGKPQESPLSLTISKLNAPLQVLIPREGKQPDIYLLDEKKYREYFPLDEYKNECNPDEMSKTLIASAISKTDNNGLSHYKLPNTLTPGLYSIRISTKDQQGREAFAEKTWEVFSTQPVLPYAQAIWTHISPARVEPGQNVKIQVATSLSVPVLIEIERNGKIISKEWVKIKNKIYSFSPTITEEDRGNLELHVTFQYGNHTFTENKTIIVPFSNKQLDVKFETFRSKLTPGQNEEWKVSISPKAGTKQKNELMACMYDMSLDALQPHAWYMNLYSDNNNTLQWQTYQQISGFMGYKDFTNEYKSFSTKKYDELNWFGLSASFGGVYPAATPMRSEMRVTGSVERSTGGAVHDESKANYKTKESASLTTTSALTVPQPTTIRKDFRETAFFFPDLSADDNGVVTMTFKVPESLTRWKIMGLAHTPSMAIGMLEAQAISQKDLMVTPNAPRFVREGDQLTLSAKITNLTGKPIRGTAKLLLFDANTMRSIDRELQNLEPVHSLGESKNENDVQSWKLIIPKGIQAIIYRVVASSGMYSDGEENLIPVLPSRVLLTETVPMFVNKGQTKTYKLNKLAVSSSSRKSYKLSIDITPNPSWYAFQALPYLAEDGNESSDQLITRFYANALAHKISIDNPQLEQIYNQWKALKPSNLISQLNKNEDLKQVMISQTPWLNDAIDETEQKRKIALFFDINRCTNEENLAIDRLEKLQKSDGSFPWFEGMQANRFMTQLIIVSLGRLKKLDAINNEKADNIVKRAITFVDAEMQNDYEHLLKLAEKGSFKIADYQPNAEQLLYLYGRSFFEPSYEGQSKAALTYFQTQANRFWVKYDMYQQALLATTNLRAGDKTISDKVLSSFNEKAIRTEEKGMYWKNPTAYYWYQAPVERQAQIIELYQEAQKDTASIDKMRQWLLSQKQTSRWNSNKATADACYALLMRGTNWLATDSTLQVQVGREKLDLTNSITELTIRKDWQMPNISANQGIIKISKQNTGTAWANGYYQYFAELKDVQQDQNTQLSLSREWLVEKTTSAGTELIPITAETILKTGDLIRTRMVIKTERDIEYVHLRDMRAAGFEPIDVVSGVKWGKDFLYYQSTLDTHTDFFIQKLNRGTYVFEYNLRVNNVGNFNGGYAQIQCLYAPGFSAHTQSNTLEVK